MNRLYLIDPTKEFTGSCYSTMSSKTGTPTHVDYSGTLHNDKGDNLTLEEYKKATNRPNLIAVDEQVFWEKYYQPYLKGLVTDWKEITKDLYWKMLECLPPVRWTQGVVSFFFISEAYTANLHACYAKYKGKYYSCTRSIHDQSQEIAKSLIETVKTKP